MNSSEGVMPLLNTAVQNLCSNVILSQDQLEIGSFYRLMCPMKYMVYDEGQKRIISFKVSYIRFRFT